jgi:hypothetical protein
MAITKIANPNANVKQLTNADIPSGQLAFNQLQSIYDAIVGSSADVANGVATYSSIQSAVNALPSGGNIFLLGETFTENVTISGNSYRISCKGHNSYLNGTLTVSGNYNDMDGFRVGGNISVSGNNNYLRNWLVTGFTFSDTGTANIYEISAE